MMLVNAIELHSIVRTLIRHKDELKDEEYDFDGIKYEITGIGPEAIRAKQNGQPEKFFRYGTLLGQYLAMKLFKEIPKESLLKKCR